MKSPKEITQILRSLMPGPVVDSKSVTDLEEFDHSFYKGTVTFVCEMQGAEVRLDAAQEALHVVTSIHIVQAHTYTIITFYILGGR